MTLQIRKTLSLEEVEAAIALRTEVFVEEQGVPLEEELDGLDPQAIHVIVLSDDRVVATCRLVSDGRLVKLGRMVVAADFRGRGIATRLLAFCDQEAAALGATEVRLAAQCYVIALYEKSGYIAYGEVFPDAGIDHRWMSKQIA
ncbi:MAG: GNAT family N-acetyltransferase [Actinobacteria bacterium]|uniref:Unannotated protein n=1 Tax=freshwater metagenome TaxID=449393 RepID=A0A6J5Z0E6_9ZZZZ|nr:GNAT family N-acetyltransferase [Actinomycetota bacterium]